MSREGTEARWRRRGRAGQGRGELGPKMGDGVWRKMAGRECEEETEESEKKSEAEGQRVGEAAGWHGLIEEKRMGGWMGGGERGSGSVSRSLDHAERKSYWTRPSTPPPNLQPSPHPAVAALNHPTRLCTLTPAAPPICASTSFGSMGFSHAPSVSLSLSVTSLLLRCLPIPPQFNSSRLCHRDDGWQRCDIGGSVKR